MVCACNSGVRRGDASDGHTGEGGEPSRRRVRRRLPSEGRQTVPHRVLRCGHTHTPHSHTHTQPTPRTLLPVPAAFPVPACVGALRPRHSPPDPTRPGPALRCCVPHGVSCTQMRSIEAVTTSWMTPKSRKISRWLSSACWTTMKSERCVCGGGAWSVMVMVVLGAALKFGVHATPHTWRVCVRAQVQTTGMRFLHLRFENRASGVVVALHTQGCGALQARRCCSFAHHNARTEPPPAPSPRSQGSQGDGGSQGRGGAGDGA